MKFKKLILPIIGLTALTAGTYLFAGNDDYSFKNFGELAKYRSGSEIEKILTADLDGDGDQDLILVISDGFEKKIIAYENKIPEKSNK